MSCSEILHIYWVVIEFIIKPTSYSITVHNYDLTNFLSLSDPAEPLSSVSSLEVHFDLLDLTELTDMSDQELAEVFADSDEENHNESPAG